jgi:hypothetical protein
MAKFEMEQVAAIAAITQLINDWTHEIDTNGGRSIVQADLLTQDCRCKLLDQWIVGLDEIAKFYKKVYAEAEVGGGVPVVRQLVSNLRVSFLSETAAQVGFSLLLFAKRGKVPFSDYCDPVEVADVQVDCRRGGDGRWRISQLEGDRIFRRER